jgi:hypothetical protein
VGDPKNNLFENNILVGGSTHLADLRIGGKAAVGNRFVRNILYATSPGAALLKVTPQKKEALAECDFNLYFPYGQQQRIEGLEDGTLADWQALGFDVNSVVADPLFMDPARGDFRLNPDSPAFKLGFRPIDMEHIGLVRKEGRSSVSEP